MRYRWPWTKQDDLVAKKLLKVSLVRQHVETLVNSLQLTLDELERLLGEAETVDGDEGEGGSGTRDPTEGA